jgi:hypothetical protein
MHINEWKATYLNQEKEVGVLACWSSAGALLDVVLCDVYTLLSTSWCENSSESDSEKPPHHVVVGRGCCRRRWQRGLMMNCAVILEYVSESESEILTHAFSKFGHG